MDRETIQLPGSQGQCESKNSVSNCTGSAGPRCRRHCAIRYKNWIRDLLHYQPVTVNPEENVAECTNQVQLKLYNLALEFKKFGANSVVDNRTGYIAGFVVDDRGRLRPIRNPFRKAQ